MENVAIAFCPQRKVRALADAHGFKTPPTLAAALGAQATGGVRKPKAFVHSFVLGAPPETWGDAACAPLVRLISELRGLCASPGSSWLAKWQPLSTHQHGDLNAANILVDVHDVRRKRASLHPPVFPARL